MRKARRKEGGEGKREGQEREREIVTTAIRAQRARFVAHGPSYGGEGGEGGVDIARSWVLPESDVTHCLININGPAFVDRSVIFYRPS